MTSTQIYLGTLEALTCLKGAKIFQPCVALWVGVMALFSNILAFFTNQMPLAIIKGKAPKPNIFTLASESFFNGVPWPNIPQTNEKHNSF